MEIIILLLTYSVFFRVASAGNPFKPVGGRLNRVIAPPPPLPPRDFIDEHVKELSEIFVEMPGGQLLSGELRNHMSRIGPRWVIRPDQARQTHGVAFIQNPVSWNLTATLEPYGTPHINPHAIEHSVYIPIDPTLVLTTFVKPTTEPPSVDRRPVVFIRMLNDFTTYKGVLRVGDGQTPSWLSLRSGYTAPRH